VISLPDPCLVVLVGAAGSGKSTLAARLFDPGTILSSDAHRAIVSGDATDQSVTRVAFGILHRRLEQRLAGRATTIVDATNVTSYARRSLVRRADAAGVPAVAIVLALEPTIVRARNATRDGRIVPEDAVGRQLDELDRSLRKHTIERDGFAEIHLVRTARELDELVIEWLPGG
jgi:protein phosphatase